MFKIVSQIVSSVSQHLNFQARKGWEGTNLEIVVQGLQKLLHYEVDRHDGGVAVYLDEHDAEDTNNLRWVFSIRRHEDGDRPNPFGDGFGIDIRSEETGRTNAILSMGGRALRLDAPFPFFVRSFNPEGSITLFRDMGREYLDVELTVSTFTVEHENDDIDDEADRDE